MTMDELGYDTLWMAEHHFQHEGYECLPNILMLRGAPGACHQAAEDRLRLQHHADVAPAAPRRGFRDGRHPDQGPHRVRRRARLSQPRGRDLRRADHRPRTPTANCSRSRSRSSSRRSTTRRFSHKGKHYTLPPEVPYRGYQLKELSAGAAPREPAGRVLAADRQRQPARPRFHGQPRHQGRGRRRRRDDVGRADPGLQGRRGAAPARN